MEKPMPKKGYKQTKEVIQNRVNKTLGQKRVFKNPEERNKKISEAKKGKPSPRKGKKQSLKTILKISNAKKNEAKINPNYGMRNKHHSKKTKGKISKRHRGMKQS